MSAIVVLKYLLSFIETSIGKCLLIVNTIALQNTVCLLCLKKNNAIIVLLYRHYSSIS